MTENGHILTLTAAEKERLITGLKVAREDAEYAAARLARRGSKDASEKERRDGIAYNDLLARVRVC